MDKISKNEMKRQERLLDAHDKFADKLRECGLEIDIVYQCLTGTDLKNIRESWLDFILPYKNSPKKDLKGIASDFPFNRIAYGGGFGEDLSDKGIERLTDDCDGTGKLYLIDSVDFESVSVIYEVLSAARFCEKCIVKLPRPDGRGVYPAFGKNGETHNFYDLYGMFIWNRKKNKCLFSDLDFGTHTWYFGEKT